MENPSNSAAPTYPDSGQIATAYAAAGIAVDAQTVVGVGRILKRLGAVLGQSAASVAVDEARFEEALRRAAHG